MRIIKGLFGNFWVILSLAFVYAAACAIATFIENDYGTMVANAVIYRSWWFNALHLYLALALVVSLISSSAWKQKKYASLLLHFSFVIIIIGAGITRFFAFEGMMHIREGQSSYSILATEPTINIMALDAKGEREQFILHKTLLGMKPKSEKIKFFNQVLELSDFEVKKASRDKNDDTLEIKLKAKYDGASHVFSLMGGRSGDLKFESFDFNGVKIFMSYGSVNIPLPFGLRLDHFELQRYPGSMSPSSYASKVQILNDKGEVVKPFVIFMNNVLDYKGYRFYQSSYDQDEKGTILSVNRDPGKNITYLGYGMLILGAILIFFAPSGRFKTLARFLQNQRMLSLLFAVFLSLGMQQIYANQPLEFNHAQELSNEQKAEFLRKFSDRIKGHALGFAQIQLQNFSGRIEPVDTIAHDAIHKIIRQREFFGMNENEIFLGMMLYPQVFKDLKMILVSDDAIKKIIGLNKEDSYASFTDFFSPTFGYKLNNYVQESSRKDPARRDNFDKNILKVDERVNLVYSIFGGSFLRIFPSNDHNWLDPLSMAKSNDADLIHQASKIFGDIFKAYDLGIYKEDWSRLDEALGALKAYQKAHGGSLYLKDSKVKAEMFLNKSNLFGKLIAPYLILGLLLLVFVLLSILRNVKISRVLKVSAYGAACVLVLLHSGALALRWYVSDHSPWSNAYESMLYIAWAAGVAGVVFFRRYYLAIAAALFLSGITLFVANLGFMDPQITPLVPVLKSYWLNIHVSVITASYGFLGLCFILGVITLILFIFRSDRRFQIDQSIQSLYALNEMSMILGLMFLSVGNFLGGVWANESWGRYWSWDPKETWALISIVVYGIVLHLRFMGFKYMPYVFSVASLLAFYVVLMTYFGVNYYLSGMHSYAAGDPVPVPMFVYYFVALSILLIVISYPKSRLKAFLHG